ncbi:MAG: FkbM family methyltransferase [Alphaproteobacteria bacterium]|nr:FkbM family methyltransferase [Alphaproteobacteria bacterium]
MSGTANSVIRDVLAEPSRIAARDWQDVCAELAPARLAKVARWLGCYLPVDRHQRIRSDVFRTMAGRIARAAVTPEPQVTISKNYGQTTVKFGVFEKAISRFALDLYKAEGFAHEPHVVRYLHDTVDRGTLLIDVGAHFGYFSCLAAARGGTVLAIELQRTLCANIETNAVLNDFWRIHTVCAAIGPEPGITQVERMDPTPGKQVTSRQFKAASYPMHSLNHEIVPVVTLDSLLSAGTVEGFDRVIVKLDIEGAEILALRGAKRSLETGAAIFVVEIHLTEIGKFNGSLDEVLDCFPMDRWRMILMEEEGDTEMLREALVAASVRWQGGDGNLCVRFEPR